MSKTSHKTLPNLPKPHGAYKEYKLSPSLRKALELPCYLFTEGMKDWAKMPDLFDPYFNTAPVVLKEGEELYISILNYLETMCKGDLLGKTISSYCQRLEIYLKNKMVKRIFLAYYQSKEQIWREEKSKESLNAETRITSNVVITRRIREIGEEDSNDDNEQVQKKQRLNQEHEDNASNPETSSSTIILDTGNESAPDCIDELFNPVLERTSGLTIVKEKNIYRFQMPCDNMFSPNKPIIQKEDLATIKGYFDICIGSSSSEASPETKYEYEVLMKRQATLQNLKDLDPDVMSWEPSPIIRF
ncbi:hypothetical protein G6F57_013550 [Rhizopus arrhizus]|uniref:Uncharacterized protein n=1 Tax=Rhizopus oryzae TaxID=64495 RepID=A0A9P6WXM9_RHIOR|nr:hypothetical protein G6F23_011093 [Rhizopus arrhizus]KAG1397873.1 hypothetical protein G6F58_011434 [Rhizopus delemar]KAG0778522.1 hypothetical protein G6F22_011183 [Rhizopus arrhizus]KAG0780134.1 hypothetical protein G6F21_012269 [Rhizopus arrhizus]KAG0804873.1 hypothetical protein G6F20_012356 [Rhizopus arrhizus]